MCRYLLLLPLLINFAACKKHPIPTTVPYTFINSNPVPVTLDIYPTLEDYAAFTHRMMQLSVPSGGSVQTTLPYPGNLWLDWYAADYSYNNWEQTSRGVTISIVPLSVAMEPDRIFLVSSFGYPKRDTARSILMNGNGTRSTWEVTVTPAQSAQYAGTHRFLLKRDFTCEYTFTDLNNVSVTRNIYFNSPKTGDNPPKPYMYLYISFDSSERDLLFYMQYNPNTNWYSFPIGRDTLVGRFMAAGYPQGDFKFIRR